MACGLTRAAQNSGLHQLDLLCDSKNPPPHLVWQQLDQLVFRRVQQGRSDRWPQV